MIVAHPADEIARWIARGCRHLELVTPYTAIAWEQGGELTAAVMYDNFTHINIDAHVRGTYWPRYFLRETFRYPFNQLKVTRLTARVPALNKASQEFVRRLGFHFEGCVRKALAGGEDLIVYGMLKDECRWL
jgi:RimJ/RimL family protein N-acetyltransferase